VSAWPCSPSKFLAGSDLVTRRRRPEGMALVADRGCRPAGARGAASGRGRRGLHDRPPEPGEPGVTRTGRRAGQPAVVAVARSRRSSAVTWAPKPGRTLPSWEQPVGWTSRRPGGGGDSCRTGLCRADWLREHRGRQGSQRCGASRGAGIDGHDRVRLCRAGRSADDEQGQLPPAKSPAVHVPGTGHRHRRPASTGCRAGAVRASADATRPHSHELPADWGVSYRLSFASGASRFQVANADPAGCEEVDGLGSARRGISAAFWHLLGTAAGITHPGNPAFRGTMASLCLIPAPKEDRWSGLPLGLPSHPASQGRSCLRLGFSTTSSSSPNRLPMPGVLKAAPMCGAARRRQRPASALRGPVGARRPLRPRRLLIGQAH
jgi:hypothetical protein